VNVPNVVGKTTAQAIAILEAANLNPDVKIQLAPGNPPGKVFSQSPVAGADVIPNTTVEIRVPIGFGVQVAVPNLAGLTQAAAIAALDAKGLGHTIVQVVSIPASWGKVVSQTPSGGQMVLPGAVVLVRVGKAIVGPINVLVPNVVGLTQAAAKAALEAKGFVVDVDLVVTPLFPIGKVYDQNPNSGVFRPSGSTVQIRVAKLMPLPLLVAVPNLIGKTPAQAQAALVAADLGSNGVLFINLSKPHNRVWWQEKAPGTMVPKNSVVKWRWNP
jgi:serine/threonine-protein kinase